MSSFKDRLLTTLIANPDNSIDIQPLVIETCGNDSSMYDNECTNCRRTIVRVIDDLIKMDWIDISDINHNYILTAHVFDRDLGKKIYSTEPLLVRLKTNGEIEYMKSKEKPIPPITNIFTTHGDNSPIAGRDVSMADIGKKNEESAESQKLIKEQLKDIKPKKWYRRWGFIVSVAVLLIGLITLLLMWRN